MLGRAAPGPLSTSNAFHVPGLPFATRRTSGHARAHLEPVYDAGRFCGWAENVAYVVAAGLARCLAALPALDIGAAMDHPDDGGHHSWHGIGFRHDIQPAYEGIRSISLYGNHYLDLFVIDDE